MMESYQDCPVKINVRSGPFWSAVILWKIVRHSGEEDCLQEFKSINILAVLSRQAIVGSRLKTHEKIEFFMESLLKNLLLVPLVIIVMCLNPSLSYGEIQPDKVIKSGTVEIGLQTGYWQAFTGIGNGLSSNRSAIYVLPQIGYVFTDRLEAGFLSGAAEILLEPVGANYFQPFSATLLGASAVFRYNFLAFGRVVPYWDFGGGLAWTDLAPRIPEESTPFEFLLETGPGFHFFLTDHFAMGGAVKLHHISNAGLGDRNTGINAVLGTIGFTFFFP